MSTSFESLLGEITSRGRYGLVTRLWCHFCPVCFIAFRRYLSLSNAINVILLLVEPIKTGGSQSWTGLLDAFVNEARSCLLEYPPVPRHLVAYNIVSLCQRDVGFSGKTAAVIRHALRLLEDDVLVTQTQGNDCEEICIEPKLVLPHVLNLAFYNNQVFELWRILVSFLICHPP